MPKEFSLKNALYFTTYLEPCLIQHANFEGILLFGGEAQRFLPRQQHLVNSGRSWTLDSDHLVCCARDYELLERTAEGKLKWVQDEDHPHWKILGEYWEELDPGCYWGGDWKSRDVAHFGYNPARKDD